MSKISVPTTGMASEVAWSSEIPCDGQLAVNAGSPFSIRLIMQLKQSLLRHGPVGLVLFAGIAFSLVTFFVLCRLEATAGETAFANRAANAISALRSRLDTDIEIVQSMASFYEATGKVARDQFHTFTEPLLAGHPGIQALEWVPRVPNAERVAYEERAQQAGYVDFRITELTSLGRTAPATSRPEHFPVFYVEPRDGNEATLGLDMSSEAAPFAAMMSARDSGVMRASGQVKLAQEPGEESGFLVFAPIYHRSQAPYRDAVAQRQANLSGFAVGAFRIRDVVGAALSNVADRMGPLTGTDLYIFDKDEEGNHPALLYSQSSNPYGPASPREAADIGFGAHLVESLDVLGRTWTVLAKPAGSAPLTRTFWLPVAALLVGLAFTSSLVAYLLANAKQTRVVEKIAEQRTAELRTARAELTSRISEREAAEAALRELSKIAKYLSPQVYGSISSGKRGMEIASQRKKLTVLFCDIADFTRIVDQREPEDVTIILNRYLTEISRIGMHYGATIDKYIGDGILMFLGDPETRGVKEDALVGVKMAMAMQKRMHELQRDWEVVGLTTPLMCRIGISTGYCQVGNFGGEARMDYTIIGSGVNIASRLQAAAPPGETLISHETYLLVRDDVRCEERPPIQAKGVQQPVVNFRIASGE